MPTTWNYVFAALPDHYSSAEVKRRIRDEYGVRMSQSTSTSTAFQALYPNKTKDGHSHTPVPGQPYCTNCRVLGHRTEECYSKGGPMHGKRRDKKVNKEDKGDTKQEDKSKKGKGKDRSKTKTSKKANQAVADEEEDDEDNRRSDSDLSAYLTGTSPRSRFGWILDGGSTNHICTERSAFTTFAPTHDSIKGIVKNGPELEVLGTGTVLISVSVKGRPDRTIKLLNVSYCPNARDNLMSESRMDRKGMEITKRNGRITIKKPNGETIMEGRLRGNLYKINSIIAPPSSWHDAAFAARSAPNLDLWHARFGHVSLKSLRYLNRHDLVTGMDLRGTGELTPCNGCAKGKHHQAPFPQFATNRASETIERIHMDLQGPLDKSILGYTYTLGMIDDHSRKGWKEFLRHKDEAPDLIKALVQ